LNDNKRNPPSETEPEEASGLASHFIKRTDADFAGKPDTSLIGRDIPIEEYTEDELDEDGEPL
jgi:hypothetical protein